MSKNKIAINELDYLSWYVEDDLMPELIAWLDDNGSRKMSLDGAGCVMDCDESCSCFGDECEDGCTCSNAAGDNEDCDVHGLLTDADRCDCITDEDCCRYENAEGNSSYNGNQQLYTTNADTRLRVQGDVVIDGTLYVKAIKMKE